MDNYLLISGLVNRPLLTLRVADRTSAASENAKSAASGRFA
jgi:hypothetical protein